MTAIADVELRELLAKATQGRWIAREDGIAAKHNITAFIESETGAMVAYGHLKREDRDLIVALQNAALPPAQPMYDGCAEGMVMVPRIPSPEMIAAAWKVATEAKNLKRIWSVGAGPGMAEVYAAMLSALPIAAATESG